MDVALASLGEFWFRTNAIFVSEVDDNACREWQRSGRCPKGSKCAASHTHKPEWSPRYVAHQLPTSSTPTASPPSSPASRRSSSSSLHSPEVCPSCESSPMPKQLCRHWQNGGNCPFGDRCHFLHPQTSVSPGDEPSKQLHKSDPAPTVLLSHSEKAAYSPPVPTSPPQAFFTPQQPDHSLLPVPPHQHHELCTSPDTILQYPQIPAGQQMSVAMQQQFFLAEQYRQMVPPNHSNYQPCQPYWEPQQNLEYQPAYHATAPQHPGCTWHEEPAWGPARHGFTCAGQHNSQYTAQFPSLPTVQPN